MPKKNEPHPTPFVTPKVAMMISHQRTKRREIRRSGVSRPCKPEGENCTGLAHRIQPEVILELYTHFRLNPASAPCTRTPTQAKEPRTVTRFPTEKDSGSGLFTSKLGLHFWIKESHLDEHGQVRQDSLQPSLISRINAVTDFFKNSTLN